MYDTKLLNGYRILYMPDHPRAFKSGGHKGYVYEHIIVAEDMLGRPITDADEIHHMDFNRANNRHGNLLVLTPEMHSKLHKWLTKFGIDDMMRKIKPEPISTCIICGKILQDKTKQCCSWECECLRRNANSNRPTKEELATLVASCSDSAIGRKYGVTGNAVKKWRKKYGIDRLKDE